MSVRNYLHRTGLHFAVLGPVSCTLLGAAAAIDPESMANAYDTITAVGPEKIGLAIRSITSYLHDITPITPPLPGGERLAYFSIGGLPGVLTSVLAPATALLDKKSYR